MKMKKIIATAMSLICLSSVTIYAEAEETETKQENIYVVDSGIMFTSIPGNVLSTLEMPMPLHPEVQWEALSNGVLRVFSTDENHNNIPDCGVIHELYGGAYDLYKRKESDSWNSCSKLVIEDSIKTIGIGAFYNSSFEEVEIHCNNEGTKVGKHAFEHADITNLTVYGDNISFSESAFYNSNICSVDLSNCNKTYIGERAFYNCKRLEKVSSAKDELNVSYQSFADCNNLSEFDFSQSLKTLYNGAFSFCESLPSKIILSKNLDRIENAFACEAIKACVLLNSETKIDDDAFKNITIYGYRGSTAEEYVSTHKDCDFIALDDIKGDVYTDSELNVSDVVLLQKYMLKKEEFNKQQYVVADINDDGVINILDLIILKRSIQ